MWDGKSKERTLFKKKKRCKVKKYAKRNCFDKNLTTHTINSEAGLD